AGTARVPAARAGCGALPDLCDLFQSARLKTSPRPPRLIGDRGLRRHAHTHEVVFEPLEIILGDHVRHEEARDVALLPDPRHEPAVAREHRTEAIDRHAIALDHREAALGGQHDVADEVTIHVAVVHGEAALAREVYGLGADQAQAVVAGEGPPQIDARLLRQPRQAGREDL